MDPGSWEGNIQGKLDAFSIGTPHADTGVREIRDLIMSGKAFAVLTPISLLPQIARGTSEKDMDEGIAAKVDGMTKIIMAATADAWLIHLPGMVKSMRSSLLSSWQWTDPIWKIWLQLYKTPLNMKGQEAQHSLSLLVC
jgi:hypothetical protein